MAGRGGNMNAQDLEYVRIMLRAALVDDSGGTKGQLEAFAEHPPADKNFFPRNQVHMVDLDDGRGGVRRVKAENSAVYIMETRSRRRPLPPIGDRAFSSSAWRRATFTLNVSQQAWIKYCYGFDLHFRYQTEICRYIWDNFMNQLVGVKIQRRVQQRLIQLVWLAVQDVSTKNRNDTYKKYAGASLATLINVERSTWSRVYSQHWKKMKELVHELDVCALEKIDNYIVSNISKVS